MDINNKKILVTGGAGFLGKYVVKKLEEKGGNVFVPKKEDYDLVCYNNIKRLMEDSHPDIIVHLAAKVGGINANMKTPGAFFYENLIMGVQLMEIAKNNNLEKFVGIGSACSYPKFAKVPFKEEDLWEGYPEKTNAPYGLAKKMLLVQSQAYRNEFEFNSIHLMPVNLYGPGDNFDLESSHVIAAIIRKFHEAKVNNKREVALWGTGSASREFLYAEDAARGIVLATEKYNRSDPINLGSGIETTIKDLAEKIKKLTKFDGKIIWDPTKPDGQLRRCLDVSKAQKEFGFKAETNFEEGLKKTIEWYIQNKNE